MENISEYIGLFIVLFLFLFPALKKWLVDKDKKKRAERPEEDEWIEPDVEEEEIEYYESPPPKPAPIVTEPRMPERLVKKDFTFRGKIEARDFETKIEERYIGTRVDPRIDRRLVSEEFLLAPMVEGGRRRSPVLDKVLRKRSSKQALVILSEIMSQPKGVG